MARSASVTIENNFSKGLITEATGLNYPENSCVETYDCLFDYFGRASRRLGFDFEASATGLTLDKTGKAINTYHWRNVTGDGTVAFVVVQVGNTLRFYNSVNPPNLSLNLIASSIDLTDFQPSGGPDPGENECQFADGLSKLYVFHPYLDNFYITYDRNTNTMSATGFTLTMRDFEGDVEDTLGVDERPVGTFGALTNHHKYNLYNQGWPTNNTFLASWDAGRSDMPSNADVWWTFKNASDAFDVSTVANVGRGNTPAPKGHFILNVYDQDRLAVSGIAGLPHTTSGFSRTSTGAFFAGRVFFSGINAPNYTGKIYFTQILERDTQIGQCYQASDPTSEDLFDLLPADGGVIAIPEAGAVYRLFAISSGLLVFATRGIWFITGSTGIGFTASDFTPVKISSIRTVSGTSFVDVNGVPMWWNTDGIFMAQQAQGALSPSVQNLSLTTIQSFFNTIPDRSKVHAKGVFNPLTQIVQWLYRSVEASSIDEDFEFDRILNLDIVTQAFYPWQISSGDPKIVGLTTVDGAANQAPLNNVVDNAGNQVIDSSFNNVAAYGFNAIDTSGSTTKYLTSYPVSGNNTFTFSEANDPQYLDWWTYGAKVDYTSYFITGYKVHGNAVTNFSPMYVYAYHEGIGKFYIQGVWDYSVATANGRVSSKQLCSFQDVTYSNNHRRVKIRGQGKSLQYLVKSLSGQPFNIIGWAALETGNSNV